MCRRPAQTGLAGRIELRRAPDWRSPESRRAASPDGARPAPAYKAGPGSLCRLCLALLFLFLAADPPFPAALLTTLPLLLRHYIDIARQARAILLRFHHQLSFMEG